MLVTDKKYRNFELTLEAKPDWGCDSGIFFRAQLNPGAAYQITMDYLGTGNGSLGRLIGEGGISLAVVRARRIRPRQRPARRRQIPAAGRGAAPPPRRDAERGVPAWKREDWNVIRVRVEGAAPKVTVWINGQLVTEQQDSENQRQTAWSKGPSPASARRHGTWAPGGFWRWRNIGIRELPE